MRILESDPELGLRVPANRIGHARRELVAPLTTLEKGYWEEPPDEADAGRLGYLILDGLLARDVMLAGSTCTELLGGGDVLQPWAAADDGLVRYRVSWHVLEPTRLALLDGDFSRALVHWPQVLAALFERAVRHTLRMSVHSALLGLTPVETRLLVLFWHLAERWGHVTPAGVTLRLRLSHELLGELVGCQRASVTTALQHMYECEKLVRRSDGSWLLLGSPPDELTRIRWQAELAAAGHRHGS